MAAVEGPIAAGEGWGEIQVRRALSSHAEGAHARRQKKAIGHVGGLQGQIKSGELELQGRPAFLAHAKNIRVSLFLSDFFLSQKYLKFFLTSA